MLTSYGFCPPPRRSSLASCTAAMLIGMALAAAVGCSIQRTGETHSNASLSELREALTFYASFDGHVDADVAAGDPMLYYAPSWGERTTAAAGLPPDGAVKHVEGGGRFGDGLEFARTQGPVIALFKADRNLAYREQDWSGTVSFWLSLDPDEDLAPGFSDPLQISSRDWNDAALFVDFTRDDTPRHFRFAAFADLDVWNPSAREWDEIQPEERPMVEVTEPPFSRDGWTHVVMTFERFNTGRDDGLMACYLDGELYGTLADREQTFTWTMDDVVIALGIQYVGGFDELALFNRALSGEEVETLYRLDEGLATLR